MGSFHESIPEYREQIEKGSVRKVYKGSMEYIHELRLHFKNKYPDYFVSGNVQNGYMDFTYFYFIPKSLKRRKLKIVIFFIHDTFTFHIWLAGYNKSVQKEYWKLFTDSGWKRYPLASTVKGVDYIIDHTLIDHPDFSDLDRLTKQIEKGTLAFIKEIEKFLSTQ